MQIEIKGHSEAHDAAAHMSASAIPLRRAVEEDKALLEWAGIPGRGSSPAATCSMPVW